MKKIVIAIIIIWFSATVTSYAGIFTNNRENTGQYGSLYGNGNSSDNSGSNGDSGFGALFRAPANGPGGRPQSDEGIGQEAPLGDGLYLLTTCCVALAVVKIYNNHKRKKRSEKK